MVTPQPPKDIDAAGWARIEAALDKLLALPADERDGAVSRLAAGDTTMAAELRSLLKSMTTVDSVLDHPAAHLLGASPAASGGMAPGTRLGAWAIVDAIGRGGMGQVYLGRRADGHFEQDVAIKVARADSATAWQRFPLERQIVARLDHPGIARLIDGGIADTGQPYMVMELVSGQLITRWCSERQASLTQRLDLFQAVCDAVAYAHRHLVIHRDIKPANVLVTDDGRVKLLDFGIARLLDAVGNATTAELMLTPAYASPEQVGGEPLSTATDVYALGLLLHELLTGATAQPVEHLPMALAIHTVLHTQPRSPSNAARALAQAPVAPAQLEGDLDAIVAKALRKEPELRYPTVDALAADLARYRAHLPVQARRGTWAYTAGRALRRHRAVAAAGAVALVALIGGSGAVAWQAQVARAEAARATAVTNFLLQVFQASDPRVASDKPRGEISARALLDAGAARLEVEFKTQPASQIELLGVVGKLYRELGETQRYKALQDRRLALAHAHPGRFVAAEIESLINLTDDDLAVPNREQAQAHLDQADRLLRQAGLDDSLLRARWWMQRGLVEPQGRFDLQAADYERALALFDHLGPHEPDRVTLLSDIGTLLLYQGKFEAAAGRLREAIASRAQAGEGSDGAMMVAWGNLGTCDVILGRYDEAAADLQQAIVLSERTYGRRHPGYWSAVSAYARLLHSNGERAKAEQLYEGLRQYMPDPPVDGTGWDVLVTYGQRLAAQGEPARALAWLEADERVEQAHPAAPFTLRRARQTLGDIDEQLGRMGDADRYFKLARDDYVAHERPEQLTRMFADERWARHLLLMGQTSEAEHVFEAVIAQDAGRHSASVALAQAGLARVALATGKPAVAVAASAKAAQQWSQVRGIRDVRMGPYLARVQARAQLAQGDAAAARVTAEAALAESLRYDVPAAASIAEARELISQADTALHKR